MADVEFPTHHVTVRVGYFQQLCLLLFAWICIHIHSYLPVALDFGCARSPDSGSVLDIYVFDGVQSARLVGVAFRYFVRVGGLVRPSYCAGPITF